MDMRILLVEDEEGLRTALADTLAASRYAVDCCANGPDALDAVCTGGYDLVLLDRMLPGLDGLSVLRQARQVGVTTPVLLLTALDAVGDRVEGLDAGADDYLAKPFDADELRARIRALLRQRSGDYGAPVRLGDLSLDTGARTLTGPAGQCEVSGREGALLEFLLKNPGQLLPRGLLLDRIWGTDSEVEEGNLNNYIFFVRRRLRQVGSRVEIQTVRGLGYRVCPC